MRTWMMVLLMDIAACVCGVGWFAWKAGVMTARRLLFGMESSGVVRLPQAADSGVDSIHRFTDEPCVFMKGETMMLVCSGSPGNGLSGSLYQQVGEPEKETGVVTMKCVRGCSDRVPAVMQYIPVQC